MLPVKKKPILDILGRLAAAEEQFLHNDFLAPMIHGGRVQVRVAGVVCQFRVTPRRFTGWGVFRPTAVGSARLVRPATLAERQEYLHLFPRVLLILSGREGETWLGAPANQGDRRLPRETFVPVHLVEEAQLFEVIEGRYDGGNCWFERLDPRHDPATAAYLRQKLAELTPASQLRRRSLTGEERQVYAARLQAVLDAQRDLTEDRLRGALSHAGAEFQGYLERADNYRVEFTVAGQKHVSVVAKKDLSVQVAGICLSGQDRKFDLHSLVGVLREANAEGEVVRVGRDNAGMAEEQYWHVHPPSEDT
jgi:hypothetical protein